MVLMVAPAQPTRSWADTKPLLLIQVGYDPGRTTLDHRSEDRRRSPSAEPRWVSVTPGARVTGLCDGCGESIVPSDSAFEVVLQRTISLKFHDECFEVYNRAPDNHRAGLS